MMRGWRVLEGPPTPSLSFRSLTGEWQRGRGDLKGRRLRSLAAPQAQALRWPPVGTAGLHTGAFGELGVISVHPRKLCLPRVLAFINEKTEA